MPHPHPIREIARQAGVSEATVDRVLNNRGGVRPGTAHGALDGPIVTVPAAIQVVTPFNTPSEMTA